MAQRAQAAPRKQQLVLLDVGGTSFKLARQTISRYPDSLLAKLVDEFPDLVDSGEALYVDRSPRAFEWILEIYRGGDYKRCVPSMDEDALERELAFYQLPTASDLGVKLRRVDECLSSLSCVSLLNEIVCEIQSLGLFNFLPLEIWPYHRYCGGRIDRDVRIMVVPPRGLEDMKNVADRGHAEFQTALDKGQRVWSESYLSDRWRFSIDSTSVEFLMPVFSRVMLDQLNREARKYCLTFSTEYCTCGPAAQRVTYFYLLCSRFF